MSKLKNQPSRIYNARPDTLDFRDKMYQATLFEVPSYIDLNEYKKFGVPILDQGTEGACTGFGLASVANYLLRRRKVEADNNPVSPRMFYEMARRYDEWPGENYSGSSARGAIKGWYKHGVCDENCWPYTTKGRLTDERLQNSIQRPLGAYYRVNHKDLIAMHSAIAEVGVLYATAIVHEGWNNIDQEGIIPAVGNTLGGHAFAIVAYNSQGFWIQNSWCKTWGKDGFALIQYDDWLANATDVWVTRLGAPVVLNKSKSIAIAHSAAAEKSETYSYNDLRPHIINLGNGGKLKPGGDLGTTEEEVVEIFEQDIPRITKNWKKKRILLYAHGGLVSEKSAVQRLSEYRDQLLAAEVYPVSFIWHSDAWTTYSNILQDAIKRKKPEGFIDAAKDFMLDRLDAALEPLARTLSGKMQWDEMKENATEATTSPDGGAFIALNLLAKLAQKYPEVEIHLVGHSAGSIFHAPLVQLLTSEGAIQNGYLKGRTGLGLKVASCTLWAPAVTIELFKEAYLPAVKNKTIANFALFTLTDKAERDDQCGYIYNKSLLYLVSNAFEKSLPIPFLDNGVPILGMEKFVNKDEELLELFSSNPKAEWILSPNAAPKGSAYRSTSTTHGDFDDDGPTVTATLARILEADNLPTVFTFSKSASSLKDRRTSLSSF